MDDAWNSEESDRFLIEEISTEEERASFWSLLLFFE
jgi:hypothetical protein